MRFVYRIYYIVLYPIIRLLYPFKVVGKEYITPGAKVICANHSNAADPLILAFCLGFRHFPRFMAKAEFKKAFLLGPIMKAGGVFFVERGKADISAVKTAMGILKNGGEVMMFPEGTRVSADDSENAKTGAIMLASRMGVPILPAYIPRNKKPFRRLSVVFGQPYTLPRLRGGSAEYAAPAAELMHKINLLGQNGGSV